MPLTSHLFFYQLLSIELSRGGGSWNFLGEAPKVFDNNWNLTWSFSAARKANDPSSRNFSMTGRSQNEPGWFLMTDPSKIRNERLTYFVNVFKRCAIIVCSPSLFPSLNTSFDNLLFRSHCVSNKRQSFRAGLWQHFHWNWSGIMQNWGRVPCSMPWGSLLLPSWE